ncbi:MAG: hypothetical protein OXG39_15370 [Chloroflexi bacterium]|nr:hypothetical protein [Chloroflexota bacterium]
MSLELLVSGIQQRFGYQTLRRASELIAARTTLSTGMAVVDDLLDGGLLQGVAHNIAGRPTSGVTSLLYRTVASMQAREMPIIYLDMGSLFDPPIAAAMGVQIEKLLLLNETALKHALFLIRTLAEQQLPCLVVLDHPPVLPLAQLKPVLRNSPLTLLTLSPQPLEQMQVVLQCRHREWRLQNGDVAGFSSDLHLLTHPFLRSRQLSMSFTIPKEEAHV